VRMRKLVLPVHFSGDQKDENREQEIADNYLCDNCELTHVSYRFDYLDTEGSKNKGAGIKRIEK